MGELKAFKRLWSAASDERGHVAMAPVLGIHEPGVVRWSIRAQLWTVGRDQLGRYGTAGTGAGVEPGAFDGSQDFYRYSACITRKRYTCHSFI